MFLGGRIKPNLYDRPSERIPKFTNISIEIWRSTTFKSGKFYFYNLRFVNRLILKGL